MNMAKTDFSGYLREFIGYYPGNPSQAYWRAIEASLLQELEYSAPMLDLGCGDGRFAAVLFGRLGIKPASACDLSAVKTASAAARGVYEEVKTADILALPYPDAAFSTVFSNCVIEHIPDDVRALREAARVLRPGGHFIFTVPSENFTAVLPQYKKLRAGGREAEAEAYARRVDKRLEHCHYRSPGEWKGLLAACGLVMTGAVYYVSEREAAVWARFLNAEDALAGLPSPAAAPARFLLSAAASVIMRRMPGEAGGALLITARREP